MHRISGAVRKSYERLAVTALAWLLCATVAGHGGAPQVSLWPQPRPAWLEQTRSEVSDVREAVAVPDTSLVTPGTVCGSAAIIGTVLKQITEETSGCGISEPVHITSVSGVALSPGASIDCTTAQALNTWVAQSAIPAFRGTSGGLSELRVASSYSCRTRNRQHGAKMSEHSLGHAIDISAFEFRNGETVTVLDGWNDVSGKMLKQVHGAACGTFGTVLGPKADAFHRNHFHFDTARYRVGSYCR